MPKLYFASPRDLPQKNPAPGMTQKIIRADAATVAITDLAPKTVVDSHKHPMEQTGVVTKGSLVMVIAGDDHDEAALRHDAGLLHRMLVRVDDGLRREIGDRDRRGVRADDLLGHPGRGVLLR